MNRLPEPHDADAPARGPGAARRRFLLVGGAGAVGALAAACGTSSGTTAKIKAQQTGNAPTTNPDMAPPTLGFQQPNSAQQQADLANLRTATAMEYAIVDAYQALSSQVPVSGGAAFTQIVPLIVAHHQSAITTMKGATADALQNAQSGPNKADFSGLTPEAVVYEPGKLKDEKGNPDTHGNAWLWSNFVVPALPSLATSNDVIGFARQLENIAVATYAVDAGVLSTVGLRYTVMTVGAIEARHAAKLALIENPAEPGAPNALFFTRDALGTNALLTFDGKPGSSSGG